MRVLRTALLIASSCIVTSVAVSMAAPGHSRYGVRRAGTDYQATLTGRDGRKVTGKASAQPTADGAGTEVTVSIEGDTPGATRPWHIHIGRCDKSGGVFGGGRAYKPMAIDAKGQGSARVTVPAVLSDTAAYYVNVHDAPTAMSIIVACGDLTRR